MPARDRRLLQNISSSVASRAIATVLAIVQVPLVAYHLGKEAYGFWLIISSFALWVSLSDLGISNGLLNALSRAFARGDDLASKKIYSSGLALILSISTLGTLLAIPISIFLPFENWFHLKDVSLRSEARLAVGLSIIFPLWTIALNGALKPYDAQQKLTLPNIANIVGGILSLALIWLATKMGGSITMLMIASFAGIALPRIAASAYLIVTQSKWIRLSWQYLSINEGTKLFSTGSRFLIISLSWLMLSSVDQIIIGMSLGASHNASYGLAMKICGYVMIIPNIIHLTLWPAYSEAWERRDFSWIRRRFFQAMAISTLGVTVALALFALIGPMLVSIWTREVVSIDPLILWWMLPYGIVFACISQITAVLYAVERLKRLLTAGIFSAIGNLALSLTLVMYFAEAGVIAATCIAGFIQIIIIYPSLRNIINATEKNQSRDEISA